MKTKLEISIPGEADRHFPIDTRAVVGKGPTADISLDVPGVSAQHFRVKLGTSDVDLRLAPGARPLTYEGRPFSGGAVPYGADFYLDRVRFSSIDVVASHCSGLVRQGGPFCHCASPFATAGPAPPAPGNTRTTWRSRWR